MSVAKLLTIFTPSFAGLICLALSLAEVPYFTLEFSAGLLFVATAVILLGIVIDSGRKH